MVGASIHCYFICADKSKAKRCKHTLFSTREIADAVGLTIYQVRGYLEMLQSSGVVEKVNSGRGRAGQWRLL
ncbi:FaeA/PapI family transcriptional regulator [Escherichia coli]